MPALQPTHSPTIMWQVCLMIDPPETTQIAMKFLLKTLYLHGCELNDNFALGECVMPARFKIPEDGRTNPGRRALEAHFGGIVIGIVAPMDAGFGQIILRRSNTVKTRDFSLLDMLGMQRGIKFILNLCLSDDFDSFSTPFCAVKRWMIDRRRGIYGCPSDLFLFALRTAKQMLKEGPDNKGLLDKIVEKIKALNYHIYNYYWLDHMLLNNIHWCRTEEYSHAAVNKFNVIPESIPDQLSEFIPWQGGYFIGNVSPALVDFRFSVAENYIAILRSLVTPEQAKAIMDLIEEHWDESIAEMPLKICYPAMEGHEWRILISFDPKNTGWSHRNGGSSPGVSLSGSPPGTEQGGVLRGGGDSGGQGDQAGPSGSAAEDTGGGKEGCQENRGGHQGEEGSEGGSLGGGGDEGAPPPGGGGLDDGGGANDEDDAALLFSTIQRQPVPNHVDANCVLSIIERQPWTNEIVYRIQGVASIPRAHIHSSADLVNHVYDWLRENALGSWHLKSYWLLKFPDRAPRRMRLHPTLIDIGKLRSLQWLSIVYTNYFLFPP